ncbi:MAG: beta-eliminating lyase-related protein, partial [Clostridiales bacterium]|nr:beta-eliminating lyase-related protein [Clostridiales bacterium]
YSRQELSGLRDACARWGVPLFMDGARMGYGLSAASRGAAGEGLRLPDVAALCDLFYIGGTKVGAMFGEALVITNDALKKDFRYHIKQRGAMLAKGRMLGIQFEVMFEDGLYGRVSDHAVDMADLIRQACADRGYGFMYDAPANQVFPILPYSVIESLMQKYHFYVWADAGDRDGQRWAAVRLCTSWATKPEHARQLAEDIRTIL